MGDICVNVDPKFTSTWDVVTYAMLMNHNVQVHLEGVYESQDLYDNEDKDGVPQQLLELKHVVEQSFKVENRDSYLRNNRKILNYLASENASSGVVQSEQAGIKQSKTKVYLRQKAALKDELAKYNAESKTKPTIVNDGLFDF
jgi:hypothetical protein